MCIRINGDVNDVTEMYLDSELRTIKSFLKDVCALDSCPTVKELLTAVKRELEEDEPETCVFVYHPIYAVKFGTKEEAQQFMSDIPAPFGFYKLFKYDGKLMHFMGKYREAA